jgi:hypothetical protein
LVKSFVDAKYSPRRITGGEKAFNFLHFIASLPFVKNRLKLTLNVGR